MFSQNIEKQTYLVLSQSHLHLVIFKEFGFVFLYESMQACFLLFVYVSSVIISLLCCFTSTLYPFFFSTSADVSFSLFSFLHWMYMYVLEWRFMTELSCCLNSATTHSTSHLYLCLKLLYRQLKFAYYTYISTFKLLHYLHVLKTWIY